MAEKPTLKPDDDTYSDEDAERRRDATVRAMIGMKPKPHRATNKQSAKAKGSKRNKK